MAKDNTAAASERDARYLQSIAHLGQRALVVDDFAGLLREGVELLAEILGVDAVYVLEHDVEAGEFVLRLAHGFDPGRDVRLPDGPDLQPGFAILQRAPVVLEDVSAETRFRPNPLLKEIGADSALAVVIRGPGHPYGVLASATRAVRSFTADEIDFAQSMANVLGTAAARSRVDAALRAERERLRLALDAGGMGDWEWDPATNRVSWSESMHVVFGIEPGTFRGTFDHYLELVHPDDRHRLVEVAGAALEGADQTFSVEHRVVPPDGSERWVSGHGMVLRDEDGEVCGMIGVGYDITERREAEFKQALLFAAEQEARAEAEKARDRLEFLAQASEVLASHLDYHETLSRVADLAVSRLADWCSVELVDEDRRVPTTVKVAHVDPARVALAQELRRKYPPAPDTATGMMAVIRTGEPLLIPVVTDDMLVAAATDDEHLAAMRELALSSVMIVPLVARGRILGALSLIAAESGRVYDDDDLALATDLAHRAAVAIDNARLYAERSQVAEALQRSLLPPSAPQIPGLDLAVRYRPVGHGAEIGGDFYDVFEAQEGSWVVAIGDVCGKGVAAADLTGLARDTIRGLSIRERSPRRVLHVLNEVVLRRGEETRFLTVAMARLDIEQAGVRMRVACAGHPPPLLLRRDGSVEQAGTPALILGLFPEIDPVDADIELRPGDALVLYTDGVIEAHGPDGLYGEGRLRRLLAAGGAGVDADALAEAIVDDVDQYRPGPSQDDVAIVVVRVPEVER